MQARQGFNVIATANNRDKGVNDLSSALRGRFNTVVLPLPDTLDEEVEIVTHPGRRPGPSLELPADLEALAEIRRVVTIFRELRAGVTADQRTTLKSPSRDAVDRRGDLGDDQRPRRSPPTSATASSAPRTSPPASSARSSRTRSRTGSSGRSTSRPSSGTAPEWTDLYRACRELG